MTNKVPSKGTRQPKTITFFVHGSPVAQGRPRFTTRGGFPRAYDPAKSKSWKETVKWQAIENKADQLLEGPLRVRLSFRLLRPKSLPKKVTHHIKKPDCDNLTKGVLDSLEGICYVRDQQICDEHTTKEYCTDGIGPGVTIHIEEIVD